MFRGARILVAPLDWGLGHAARCVPIVRTLLEQDAVPVIGADKAPLALLREEFPTLEHVRLPGMEVRYAAGRSQAWAMARQLPRMLLQVREEQGLLTSVRRRMQLHAVISMPSGVFKPYAGVSTAVLLFTRTDSGGTDQVWFYDMGADGFSLDDKRTPKLSEAEAETQFTDPAGQATALLGKSDIADILSRYGHKSEAKRKRTEQSFLVPVAELKANGWDLSMNRYKELVYEPVDYPSPEELINGTAEEPGLKQLAQERLRLLDELEGLLK